MIKDILVIENFIEKNLLEECLNQINSCKTKSSAQSFYMKAEDRI
jgi:hypothetical protein